MHWMDLANCTVCGRLFARSIHSVCSDCLNAEEDDFEKIRVYLRENDAPDLADISSATGVAETRILSFLRSGRLISTGSLSYPCSSCGEMIQTGTICAVCRVKNQLIFDQVSQSLRKVDGSKRNSYYSKHRDTNS